VEEKKKEKVSLCDRDSGQSREWREREREKEREGGRGDYRVTVSRSF
jgi:hypothetical protein